MSCHQFISLGNGLVALRQMDVHLITIKIGIVSVAVSIMHPDRLLLGQNSAPMSHDTWLVKSRLSVDKKRVIVGKMSVNNLPSNIQKLSKAISLLCTHVLKMDL